jgi:spoIIIJ-associated protein
MRYTAATEEAAVAGALDLVGASRDEADYEVLDVSAKGVTVRIKPRQTETPVAAAPLVSDPVASVPVASVPASAEASLPVAAEPGDEEVEDEQFDTEEDDLDEEELEEADSEIEAQLVVDDEDAPTLEEENEALEEDEADEISAENDSYEDDGESDEDGEDEAFEGETEAETPALETATGAEAEATEPEAEPATPVSDEIIADARLTAQQFLDKMGMEATCLYESGATASSVPLIIEGNDVGILIGKHGSTLQAFQYLLNLTVNNGTEPDSGVRVVVDAGNYRARRQNSLEQTARAAAQRARMSGRPVRLDAMPASERRIIHMFLQNEQGITTQSEGREPQRRLVIFPAQGGTGGGGRYEERGSSGGGRGMGGFNRGRGGRGFRR